MFSVRDPGQPPRVQSVGAGSDPVLTRSPPSAGCRGFQLQFSGDLPRPDRGLAPAYRTPVVPPFRIRRSTKLRSPLLGCQPWRCRSWQLDGWMAAKSLAGNRSSPPTMRPPPERAHARPLGDSEHIRLTARITSRGWSRRKPAATVRTTGRSLPAHSGWTTQYRCRRSAPTRLGGRRHMGW